MMKDDFDPTLPVSRGQWRAIAEATLALSGEPAPDSRFAATELLVRLAGATPHPDPTGHVPATPPDQTRQEIDDLWNGLEHRATLRERRGGYHQGWKCWGCQKFVSGANATCNSCGQHHGGVFHQAYATR
jgi:hypothetical protein